MKNANPSTIVIGLLGFLYFFSYQQYGVNLWDEGVPLSGAQRLLNGERPILDFLAYPPGKYLIFALGLIISKGSMLGPRLLVSIISGIMAGLVYYITSSITSRSFALIPVVVFLLAPSPYYYRFLTLSFLILMTAVVIIVRNDSWSAGTISGFLIASTIWLRFEVGVLSLLLYPLCIVSLISFRIRPSTKRVIPWFKLCIGFLPIIISGMSLIYYLRGISVVIGYFRTYFDIAVLGHKGMRLQIPQVWRTAFWNQSGFWLGFESMLIVLLFPFLLLSWISAKHFKGPTKLLLHFLHFIAMISYGLVAWRAGYGNFLRVLPILIIPMVSTLFLHIHYDQKTKHNTRAVYIVCVSGFLGFCFLTLDSLFVNSTRYESIGRIRVENQDIRIDSYNIKTDFYHAFIIEEMKSIGELYLPRNSFLVCFPLNPIWNFTLNRPNPMRYEWLLPDQIRPSEVESVINELRVRAIPSLIINDVPLDGKESRRFSIAYPKIMRWIEREYFMLGKIDEYQIFKTMEGELPLASQITPTTVVGMVHFDTIDYSDATWNAIRVDGYAKICYETAIDHYSGLKLGFLSDGIHFSRIQISGFPEGGEEIVLAETTTEANNSISEFSIDLDDITGSHSMICIEIETDEMATNWIVDPLLGRYR